MKRVGAIIVATLLLLLTATVLYVQHKKAKQEHLRVLHQQAQACWQSGDYEKAIACCTQIIKLAPKDTTAYWSRAFAYGEQKKYDLAIADLRTVNDLAPNFADAYGSLGWYLILQGKFDEAQQPTEKARALAPQAVAWAVNLGHIHLLAGDVASARELYRQGLSLLKSEEEFKAGPVTDFELFIAKNWQVEACQRALEWMQQQFETIYSYHIQADDYLNQGIELMQAQKFLEAAGIFQLSIRKEESGSQPRPEKLASALNWIGFAYYRNGEYDKAAPFYQRSMTIHEKLFGPEHQEVAKNLNNLAELYRTQGSYAEAEPLYQRSLGIYEKVFGLEHPEVANCLNNLAELYRAQGSYAEAEPLYQRSLGIYKKVFGLEHPEVANCLNNLALLRKAEAKYNEAILLYQHSLSIFERISGQEHSDVARVINNLAIVYFEQGNYPEAERLHRRSLAIREKVFGLEHPEVATSLNNLAVLYRRQSDYAKAQRLYERSLAICEKVFGPEHPEVAASLDNQAVVYYVQGRYGEAELLYGRSLAIREKVLGSEHPDVAVSLSNLAGLYDTQGSYAKAEPLYERSLAICEKVFGSDHPEVATSLNNLAVVYDNQGNYAEAESLYARSLAIYEKTFGAEHPHVAMGLNNLATLYAVQGKSDKAESLYRRSLVITEKVFDPEHSAEVATSLNNLAGLLDDQGKYDEAKPLYERSLAIREKVFGRSHPEVAASLTNLAGLHDAEGQSDVAEQLFLAAQSNMLHQIQRYFVHLSETERREFYRTIDHNFEIFNSFAIRRSAQNKCIIAAMYDNQLATKAVLLNSITKVKRLISMSGTQELIELYNAWLARREYLARVYTLSEAELVQRGINKDSLEAAANEVEKQLSRRSETFAQATDTTLFTWRDIRKTLQANEAAIEMVRFNWFRKAWTDTVYYAALIVTPETKDHPELVLLKNGNDLEGKFYRGYVKCRQTKNGLAYQQYWQPIKEKLKGITKVYFSPDGIYNQMNLNILSNPETGAYLLDEIDIHLITSTKDLLQFNKKKATGKQAELFGRPAYQLETQQLLAAATSFPKHGEENWLSDQERAERGNASFSDLPGTEKEVNDIGQLLQRNRWQASVHTGKDALEEAVKAVKNPAILHIATHGFFVQSDSNDFRKRERNVTPIFTNESHLNAPSGTNPMLRSGLLLAGAATYLNAEKKPETEDGILTAYEAANLDLDNTELIVLSACETGLGEVKNGEGVYGLQRAFKVSGAKTILMSLWKVDDTATQELMTSFYDTWLKSGNKRQAFRQAQQQIRDKYKLPEYWGAFVMVGE